MVSFISKSLLPFIEPLTVGNKDELNNNNNEFKTVCPEGTMMQMMNSSLTPEQPQNQLLSNTEQLAMECGAKVAETIISR